jgi:hypothetical protein
VGKTALLYRMVLMTTGEVTLCSEAATLFLPNAVRRHVAHYADPSRRLRRGRPDIREHGPVAGQRRPWGLLALRALSSAVRVVLGHPGLGGGGKLLHAAGAVAACASAFRRRLQFPPQRHRARLSGVYDPEASAREVAAESSEGLVRQRVRMVTLDLEATLSRPALLNPLRFPGFARALWSHKLLRWLEAPVLVILLSNNLLLLNRALFQDFSSSRSSATG